MKAPPCAALLAGLLAAGAASPQEDPPLAVSRTYVCADGAVLRVAYLNPPKGPRMAVVDWAGRLVPMRPLRSASGAAYADIDERRGLRWRTKGDEGFLAYQAPGASPGDITLLEGCAVAGGRSSASPGGGSAASRDAP